MRRIGTQAFGIRLPIISTGDDLAEITVSSILNAEKDNCFMIRDKDIIGVTEAVVAKAQDNYADIADIAVDVRKKFSNGTVGVVFPIMSRNRFMNILKGIALGVDKAVVLLSFPSDEVGNPIMNSEYIDDIEHELNGMIPGEKFKQITNNYSHQFTGVNYIDLYMECAPNIEVYVSADPRDILKITDKIIVAEIHNRNRTKKRLEKAGAKICCTLSDLLCEPVERDGIKSGFNELYGVLGSNLSTGTRLKLFPRNCLDFAKKIQSRIKEETGKNVEVLVYGDGAFKDPECGIWELADPVVSPGYTERLAGQPNELKLKYIADSMFAHLSKEEQGKAVNDMIKQKDADGRSMSSEGTTPRKYADLLGSLCDLMSGSGDKGTPVVLIQGYFDDYSAE